MIQSEIPITTQKDILSTLSQISFDHPDRQGLIHHMSVLPEIKGPEGKKWDTLFHIIDNDTNKEEGSFQGKLELNNGEKIFYSINADNKHTIVIPNKGTTKVVSVSPLQGLLRATIVQLLSQRVIDTWYSDIALTEGGMKMYTALENEADSLGLTVVNRKNQPNKRFQIQKGK